MNGFLNTEVARAFLTQALIHYEKQNVPPWFIDWLDDLYIRLGENLKSITCYELAVLDRLYEEECWMPAAFAVNSYYKFRDATGQSLVGLISY